jgi:hypothetical protein
MKWFQCGGFVVFSALTLHSQIYWTNPAPDCAGVGGPVPISGPSGTTLGYSCLASGTFEWLAAGGPWSTAIRVAAPASAPIGVDYQFYDVNGGSLSLDTTAGNGREVKFALNANQPSEVDLSGAAGTSHSTTQTGSAYARFYCPDSLTCSNVLPQLLYADLGAVSWSLSAPIAWDNQTSTQWSAEGIDDGNQNRVSFVIYNEDITSSTPSTFAIRVYDSRGNLTGSGTTKPIAPKLLPGGSYGQGGTYGDLLSNVVSPLPSGVFKVVIDGGAVLSAVEMLQFTGAAATTLQVAYDGGSGALADTSVRRHVTATPGPATEPVRP